MNRQRANLELLELLRGYFLRHPDIRFGQALLNLDVLQMRELGEDFVVADPYHEEPHVTLQRVQAALQR